MGRLQGSEEGYAKAKEKFDEALALSEKFNDTRTRSDVYINLAYFYQYQESYLTSSNWANKALPLAIDQWRKNTIAHSLALLGENAKVLGRQNEACRWIADAAAAYQNTPVADSPPLVASLMANGCV